MFDEQATGQPFPHVDVEGHGEPWHMLEVVQEAVLVAVQGNEDDLKLLSLGLQGGVELDQVGREVPAGPAPVG